jgi:hypothetical protein
VAPDCAQRGVAGEQEAVGLDAARDVDRLAITIGEIEAFGGLHRQLSGRISKGLPR